MNHRTVYLLFLLLFFIIGQLIGSFPLSAQTDSVERPNIIVLLTDQQSASMMSATGNDHLDTPEMDRLAREGVRFDRAYVTYPLCVPARVSLLTGVMPSTAGMQSDGRIRRNAERLQRNSLGTLFRENGYKVVYGGKVHQPRKLNPRNIGFEMLTRNARNKLAEKASSFIKKDHEKPFLLYTSFIQPHDICYMAINAYRRTQGKPPRSNPASSVVKKLLDPMRERSNQYIQEHTPPLPENYAIPEQEPETIQKKYVEQDGRMFRSYVRKNWTELDWRLHRWLYARLTERVDRQIGTVMDAVRQAGIEEETLIVLTSEHGDMDAAHRLEHKSIPYEEAARVPMVVTWKNHIEGGRVDDRHLVSNGLDLMPTLLDYAGITSPEHLRGRSLRPLLQREDVDWRDRLVVETQFGRMLRTDRYKYVVYNGAEGTLREQLTDLKNDPGEMHNLATDQQHLNKLNQFRSYLQKWVSETNDKIGNEFIIPPE